MNLSLSIKTFAVLALVSASTFAIVQLETAPAAAMALAQPIH
ncbi:MAG: hypothetical protein ACEQSK_13810 [Sphingomonadaceae bacterium]